MLGATRLRRFATAGQIADRGVSGRALEGFCTPPDLTAGYLEKRKRVGRRSGQRKDADRLQRNVAVAGRFGIFLRRNRQIDACAARQQLT